MATTEAKLLTADDLLRLNDEGVRGELIRGVLSKTMPAGQEHGAIVANLVYEIQHFVKPRRIGTLVASDSGVWLERDPDTVREPDIAFTSAEKLPLGARIPGYAKVVPDLVVEVVSPNDSQPEARERAQMWLSYGVALVWMVYPRSRMADAYHADGAVVRLEEDDALDGGDALPGFSCPVSAVFDV